MNKVQKIIKTVFLVLVWVCLMRYFINVALFHIHTDQREPRTPCVLGTPDRIFHGRTGGGGLYLEITGPTLIDLKIRTKADYEQVAVAVSGRSVGYFIGSAIGGVLVDKFGAFCDLMIAVCLTGGAAATVFVPFSPVVELLWFIIVVQGTFEGVINIAGQKLILKLWKEKAASPLHILHGGFGIGSFIIPLIANPFLAVPKQRNNQNISVNQTSQLSSNVSTVDFSESSMMHMNKSMSGPGYQHGGDIEYIRESRIEIAYLISALITLALSSVFYTYHIRGQRKYRQRETDVRTNKDKSAKSNRRCKNFIEGVKRMINPATCTGGRFLYGVEIFGLLFVYFINIVGGERILGKFIRAYSIEQLGFSVSDGSYINTVFWISFAVGRVSGFIAARYIPIRILILIETSGVLISTIFLNIFATTNATALWVLSVSTGLFHAPLFPSGIGWGDYHVEMTGMAITFLLLGGSIGGIIYLRLTGFLFETFGPRSFLYHLLGYGIGSFVLAIVLNLVGAQHGSRFNSEEKDVQLGVVTDCAENERMVEKKA